MTQPAPLSERRQPTAEEFKACQNSPEFKELRSKQRGFTFPLTILGMVWFFIYVLIAMYAPHIMNVKVIGNVNVAIFMGLSQFVLTFAITWLYVSYANKTLEPRSRAIREALESPTTNITSV